MYRMGIGIACAIMLALPVMAQVKTIDAKTQKAKPAKATFVVGVSGMT